MLEARIANCADHQECEKTYKNIPQGPDRPMRDWLGCKVHNRSNQPSSSRNGHADKRFLGTRRWCLRLRSLNVKAGQPHGAADDKCEADNPTNLLDMLRIRR